MEGKLHFVHLNPALAGPCGGGRSRLETYLKRERKGSVTNNRGILTLKEREVVHTVGKNRHKRGI